MIQHSSEITLFLNYCIFSGSAEALVRCGGKLLHLLIAYFLSNTCAKYYENTTMLSGVIAKNVEDVFLRHTVQFHHCSASSILLSTYDKTVHYKYNETVICLRF